MNNKIFFSILILLIIGAGAFAWYSSSQSTSDQSMTKPEEAQQQNQIKEQKQLPDTTAQTISVDELAQHNNEDSCWIVYQGQVYDITSFLPEHPGTAAAIRPSCGNQDFESNFENQHGMSKVDMFMEVSTLVGDLAS